jgi:hypothetical protein
MVINSDCEHMNEINSTCEIVAHECNINAGRFYVYAVPLCSDEGKMTVGFDTNVYSNFFSGSISADELNAAEKLSYWVSNDGNLTPYIITGWKDRLKVSELQSLLDAVDV